jgi:hypothetical protein
MADPPKTTGTVFFVLYAEPDCQFALGYAVTAKHVVEVCGRDSQDGKVLLRTNIREGKAEFVETKPADWFFHPTDETVDVAVMPIANQDHDFLKSLDIQLIHMRHPGIADEQVIREQGIGPGDEVYIVGLFSNRPGKLRNIPIARGGNIAAIPGEPVNVPRWGDRNIEAYLIESRSIGGLSGSPVFVQPGPLLILPGQPPKFAAHRSGPSFFAWLSAWSF